MLKSNGHETVSFWLLVRWNRVMMVRVKVRVLFMMEMESTSGEAWGTNGEAWLV